MPVPVLAGAAADGSRAGVRGTSSPSGAVVDVRYDGVNSLTQPEDAQSELFRFCCMP